MAAREADDRNLTREDVIAKVVRALQRVDGVVTVEEVTAIVDNLNHAAGYDSESVRLGVEESLRLWASRDQAGMICALRLNQEDMMHVQKTLQEENEQAKARLAEVEAQVTMLLAERQQAKQEKRFKESESVEGQAKILKEHGDQLAEVQRQLTALVTKETGVQGSEPKKERRKSSTVKELSEEQKKDQAKWGHLQSYDEAFEELKKNIDRNDLTKFVGQSERIRAKHDVLTSVKGLIPGLYTDALERLGSSVKLNYQPYVNGLDELMEFHKTRKPKFDEKVTYIAEKTQGKAVIPAMKGRPRCESKAAFKYTDATGTSWHRCTDIVRATILYDDIESMYQGLELLEKLDQDKEMEIIEFNDRYQKPMPGNYRDLQLSVKIDSMVCELQLNTKVMAFVKEHAGHRSFEVSRELVAAVQESNASRCEEILRWGTELLSEKSVEEILNNAKKPVLHEAAGSGNADLVSVFLDYGADMNLQSSDGKTALHKAMAGGHERAAWALICAGAKFLADNQNVTPLMEGLLKLRVNPDSESVARAVSTLAQMCDENVFENLNEKLEDLARKRLVRSSDLVVACKDGNLQKVERLLRDWADPNSVVDELHVTFAAMHGGQMDFSPERARVLRRVLDFHADPDATMLVDGKKRTALEAALRSSDHRAVAGIAELVKHGARLMNRIVKNFLPPWTSKQIQEADPGDLVRHILATWQPLCSREFMPVDYSLRLKGRHPLDVFLVQGLEAAKRCDVEEEKKQQLALYTASALQSSGNLWEYYSLRGECPVEDFLLTKTLEEASGPILSVAWHGQLLAVGSADAKVRIYGTEDLQLLKTIEEATDTIRSIAWVHHLLAVGGEDEKIRIYDSAQEFNLLQTLEDASDSICSVAWSGPLLAAGSGSTDCKVRIYHAVDDFQLLKTLEEAGGQVLSVAWSGQLLAAGSADRKVRIYDGAQDFILSKSIEDASDWIPSISWSGGLLAVGGDDRTVRIYDSVQEFVLTKSIADASDYIYAVAFAGNLLAVGGKDCKVRIYNADEDFRLINTLESLEDARKPIGSVSCAGHRLATGGQDSKLRIYDLVQEQPKDEAMSDFCLDLVLHNSGRDQDALIHAAIACLALAAAQDQDADPRRQLQKSAHVVSRKLRSLGQLELAESVLANYALKEFHVTKRLQEATGPIYTVAWGAEILAVGGKDKKVRIFESGEDFQLLRTLEATNEIYSAAWSGKLLAVGSDDCKVRIYNGAEDYQLLKILQDASAAIMAVSWSGQLLAAGDLAGKVRIYNTAEEFLLAKTLEEADEAIYSISWCGHLLAAGGEDHEVHEVRIYDANQDFLLVKTLEHASELILSISWAENLLAVGGCDKKVRVYDAAQEFQLLKTMKDATKSISSVSWCGNLLAAGSWDAKVYIYDSSQEFVLIKMVAMPDEVFRLGWHGDHLAIGLADGTVRILDSRVQYGTLELHQVWEFSERSLAAS